MSGPEKRASGNDKVDFHGGTVIGKDGKEVAITEDMVQRAIRELDPEAFQDSASRQHKH